MTFDADQPSHALGPETAEPRHANVRETGTTSRDLWPWVQIAGLALLGAGVAVLVVFALTLGGR